MPKHPVVLNTLCLLTGLMLLCPSIGFAAPKLVVNPAPDLVPHKALYEVRMTSSKTGSQIADISGRMYFEWKPSCDGWITNHKFSLDYEYADNPSINISSDFSTFESFDGKSLNFTSSRKRNGEAYEELRGIANFDGKGSSGKADYKIPENLIFILTPGTLFPTAHTIGLIDEARRGKKFYNARIFDGSDDAGPVDINSFIGSKVISTSSAVQNDFKPVSSNSIDRTLLETPAWNVRMAFFPIDTPESSSDYELSMVFHENGIISDMIIEYADFTVSQKLIALEKVKPETCKN